MNKVERRKQIWNTAAVSVLVFLAGFYISYKTFTHDCSEVDHLSPVSKALVGTKFKQGQLVDVIEVDSTTKINLVAAHNFRFNPEASLFPHNLLHKDSTLSEDLMIDSRRLIVKAEVEKGSILFHEYSLDYDYKEGVRKSMVTILLEGKVAINHLLVVDSIYEIEYSHKETIKNLEHKWFLEEWGN